MRILPIFPLISLYTLSVAWIVFRAPVHPLATYPFHSFSPLSQSSCSEQQRIQRFRRKIADFTLRSFRFWCWRLHILWLGLPTQLTAIILLQLPELASCSKNMDVDFLHLSQERNYEGSQTILLISNKVNMPALYDSYWRFLDTQFLLHTLWWSQLSRNRGIVFSRRWCNFQWGRFWRFHCANCSVGNSCKQCNN